MDSTRNTRASLGRDTQPIAFQPLPPVAPNSLIYYRGPDIDMASARWIKDLISASGISSAVIEHEESQGAARAQLAGALRRLDGDGQLMLDMHGLHEANHHVVEAGIDTRHAMPTVELLAWALRNMKRPSSASGLPVLHLISCHIGTMRREIVPGTPLWRSAYFVLYSGKKDTSSGQFASSLKTMLRYLQHCKERQRQADPLRMFLLAGMCRGDCMTLLGGELSGPVSWHAPKRPTDFVRGAGFADNLDACADDLDRLAQAARTTLPEEEALVPSANEAMADIFHTRLARDDGPALNILLRRRPDLRDLPCGDGKLPMHFAATDHACAAVSQLALKGACISERDADGNTALILAATQEIDPADIPRAKKMLEQLIALGADPNEVDGRGYSALLCAVEARRADAVEVLLEQGANHHVRHGDVSPLTIARANKDVRIIALLAAADMRARTASRTRLPQAGGSGE